MATKRVSAAAAAELVGLSTSVLRCAAAAGLLTRFPDGRYDAEQLVAATFSPETLEGWSAEELLDSNAAAERLGVSRRIFDEFASEHLDVAGTRRFRYGNAKLYRAGDLDAGAGGLALHVAERTVEIAARRSEGARRAARTRRARRELLGTIVERASETITATELRLVADYSAQVGETWHPYAATAQVWAYTTALHVQTAWQAATRSGHYVDAFTAEELVDLRDAATGDLPPAVAVWLTYEANSQSRDRRRADLADELATAASPEDALAAYRVACAALAEQQLPPLMTRREAAEMLEVSDDQLAGLAGHGLVFDPLYLDRVVDAGHLTTARAAHRTHVAFEATTAGLRVADPFDIDPRRQYSAAAAARWLQVDPTQLERWAPRWTGADVLGVLRDDPSWLSDPTELRHLADTTPRSTTRRQGFSR